MTGDRNLAPGLGYRLLSLPLILFWILHGIIHGLKHRTARYLSMRTLGFKSNPMQMQVWVHASSVGEVQAISPLVQTLRNQGETILFTSFTASGYHTIRQNFPDSVSSGVIPFDFWWLCHRFFKTHKIKLGLIMETELWPELLYQAYKQDFKMLQVNARLSSKSSESGPFARRLLASTLNYFSLILTRSKNDRDVLIRLGAVAEKIVVVGNLKSTAVDSQPRTRLIERDYLLLASSHANEEQLFLQARPDKLKHRLLVIAPRHPDRRTSIQAQIEQLGMVCKLRSRSDSITADTEVYLADTLGEMKSLMAHAEVVIMGGSFTDSGGHNLIEPASLGCPTITGPSDSNISEDIKLLGDGVVQVEDMEQCWHVIADLLDNPLQAEKMGSAARAQLARQPDMVEKYMASITPWL